MKEAYKAALEILRQNGLLSEERHMSGNTFLHMFMFTSLGKLIENSRVFEWRGGENASCDYFGLHFVSEVVSCMEFVLVVC